MSSGILYIVATPIGNLEDITLRAIKILQEVDYIACEDTRKTGLLLGIISENHRHCEQSHAPSGTWQSEAISSNNHVGDQRLLRRSTPRNDVYPHLLSYYEQNEAQRIPQIISLLKDGKNVALVSNAGTPTISDPGYKLVRECIKEGIKVESIPGPSAVISALVSSGLPTDKFLFLGFLPKKSGHRKSLFLNLVRCFESSKNIHPTVIFYESPFRLIDTLKDLQNIFGDLEVIIARELTKIHEEIRREKISESLKHFSSTLPRGEFTVLFSSIN